MKIKINVLRTKLLLILTLYTCNLYGQFIVGPVAHSQKEFVSAANAKTFTSHTEGDTLQLPFWDDFSFSTQSPDTSLWNIGEDVFINPSIGLNPPSVNVATFDGSNGQGIPYNLDATIPEVTDVLESKIIDLSGLTPDDKVVFSFYWQLKGNGNQPNRKDTLSLIFYDNLLLPVSVWTQAGSDTLTQDSIFRIARIPLEAEYLHAGFQFRFESFGNPGGPFDQWHVDYVYLNRDRPIEPDSEESLLDHAIGNNPSPIFKPYSTIPRSQLFSYSDTIFSDISFSLTNFENAIHNVSYTYHLIQIDSIVNGIRYADTLFSLAPTEGDALIGIDHQKNYTIPALNGNIFDPLKGALNLVSEVTFITDDEYFISTDDGEGNITYLIDEEYNYRLNDTSRFEFEVNEILAYDDGVAENTAGVKSETGGAQIAVFFNIPTSDTLTHIDISFPNIKDIPDNPRFKLSIARELMHEEPIYLTTQEFTAGDTVSAINHFTSFEFDKPVILSGSFFVIFEQFSNNRFPIGLDQNTHNGDKIYLNYGNAWEANSILDVNGSLMIRPRFADSDYVVTNASGKLIKEVEFYPNPADDMLQIKGSFTRYALYNLSGQIVDQGDRSYISVRAIKSGLYILKIFSNERFSSHKVIIKH
ncbi:MAG: T9SS type A sorting domain-containing protein [Reichenbachiella sp.]